MTARLPRFDSARRLEALAVGAAIVDIIEQVEDGRPEALGLRRGVATLMEADRARRVYATMGETRASAGGSAANTICCMSRMGVRAGFVGKVADDQFGEIVLHDLQSDGVAFATPSHTGGEDTGRCLILVTPDSERTMCTELGASKCLDAEDVDPGMVRDSALLYLESYLLDGERNRRAFDRALALARASGTAVALSLSDPGCVERCGGHILGVLEGGVDVLLGNRDEFLALAEVDDEAAAIDRVAERTAVVALTSGAEGATAASGDERVHVPAMEIDDAIDTTGAGDLFATGFLHGLLAGATLEESARRGCRAAGEVVQVLGARPAGDLRRLVD